MLANFWTGFATGLSLIVAIGSQNAFVLRLGIRREHVLPLVLFRALFIFHKPIVPTANFRDRVSEFDDATSR